MSWPRIRSSLPLVAALLALALVSCSSKSSSPLASEAENGARPAAPGPVPQPGAAGDPAAGTAGDPADKPAGDPATDPADDPTDKPGVPAQSSSSAATIVDRPIRFDDERKRLTVEYRRIHQDPAIDSVEIEPRMIVLHYTGGSSADGTWRYFNRLEMEGGRAKLKKAGVLNVSSHFLVDRDGTIYRLMPETWMARHCIGLNHIAIGVENVGDGDRYPLTQAQVDANVALIRYLAGEHSITHLIGHYESRRFDGGPLFVERDPAYRNRKPDPGTEFMEEVRAGVADLDLAGPPAATAR